ncbi:MAG: hypothetical protein IKN55_11810 [Oscillospiraceae bacterium]|nr:hypothetical protein [Oscillospiraceae bacterium]
MKNSKEMADAVFRIRDACLEQQRRRKRIAGRIAAAGSAVCMLALVFIGIRYVQPAREPLPNTIRTTEAAPTEHDTAMRMTEAAVQTESASQAAASQAEASAVETEPETHAATEATDALSALQQDPTEPPDAPQEVSGHQPEPTAAPAQPETLPTEPIQQAPTTAQGSDVQEASAGPHNEQDCPPDTEANAFSNERMFRRAELGEPPVIYQTAEKPVEPEFIREELGEVKLFGDTQEFTGKAFRIEGYPPEEAIAVQFEENGGYYFYTIDML